VGIKIRKGHESDLGSWNPDEGSMGIGIPYAP
jgi:hypothetical protein